MNDEGRRFLEDAASRERPNLVSISVRDLLANWGAKRRGYWIVDRIERDLEEAGLITEPAFTQGWIDSPVTLFPRRLLHSESSTKGTTTPEPRREGETEPDEIALIVGNLRSATQGICSVSPESTLIEAQSKMMMNDYSQLAVMSGARDLRGAITWESIAQASIRANDPPTVRDCIISAESVSLDDDLMYYVPRIAQAGFVFVRAQDRIVSGIVTTADLSEEFARLAKPFFLLGEIERRLRRAVDRMFSPDELREVQDPQEHERHVDSAADLTIGECVRLLQQPDKWEKTGWRVERKIFVEALDGVRETRNEVMHFSPDPLEDDQIRDLGNFTRWLKILDP